jgi:hypothetical protein
LASLAIPYSPIHRETLDLRTTKKFKQFSQLGYA